jgi:mono/diheme cytochrome c family protein
MKMLRVSYSAIVVMLVLGLASCRVKERRGDDVRSSVTHGRYLAVISGCNDCHTTGYALAEGKIDEKDWLTGDRLGWNGPWGTTYPTNLRLLVSRMTEEEWVRNVKNAKARPPMPWYVFREMSDRDFRDLYRYIRSLGAAGVESPAFVPPEEVPAGPVIRYPK